MSRTLEAWFRRKYGLPPTDPRFLSMTREDMEVDFWMHHYADRPGADDFESDGFDAEEVMAKWAAEAEAEATEPPPARGSGGAGQAGGGAYGEPPPADDWEDVP